MYLTIDTGNTKIIGSPRRGFAAALTLPIQATCPKSCPLRNEGCYAQGGHMAIHESRLAKASAGKNALVISKLAASEVVQAAESGLARARALRLFQAGDARTNSAAKVLASASRKWMEKGGLAVWGYTHAWRDVSKDSWNGVSILASVESVKDAKKALREHKYAPALVVNNHPEDGRAYDIGGVTMVPCPEQTRGVPCIDCRLCWDADALAARKTGIAFAVHGNRVNNVKRKLPLLNV